MVKLEKNSRYMLQRQRFEIIKDKVSVTRLATDLIEEASGSLKHSGGRLRGYCPVCGHGNHSEAFNAQPEGTLWNCFSCGEGGDVIELARLAGSFQYASEAVAWLGFRYGIDLPERPESWYRKQSRQERLREQIKAERREVRRRRMFKYLIVPELEFIEPEDREHETWVAWERTRRLPID